METLLKPTFSILEKEEEILLLFKQIKRKRVMSFDFETTGLHHKLDKILIVAITYQCGHSFVMRWNDFVSDQMKKVCEDSSIVKVAHNIKYEGLMLKNLGISINGLMYCTFLIKHMMHSESDNGLKDLVKIFLPQYGDYGVDVKNLTDQSITPELMEYCAIDAEATYRLFLTFMDSLNSQESNLLHNLIMPFCRVLIEDFESQGVYIDTDNIDYYIDRVSLLAEKSRLELYEYKELKRFISEYNKYEITKKVEEIVGKITARRDKIENKNSSINLDNDAHIKRWNKEVIELRANPKTLYSEVNFNSPKQMQQLLYSKSGFGFKSYDNEARTDAESLSYIDHPFIETFRVYKTAYRILGTYLESIKEKSVDGKIYGSLNQAGTRTGRLCIEENQRVLTVGGHKAIKNIEVGDLVYCYNNKNKPTIRKVLNKWDKGTASLVEVKWRSSNNEAGSLLCTENHHIRTRDRGWVKAKELKKEKVYHLTRKSYFTNGKLRYRLYGTNYFCELEQCVIKTEHFKASTHMHIHHKDFDSSNNNVENLEVLTASEHSRLHINEKIRLGLVKWDHLKDHRAEPKYGEDNPLYIKKSKYALLKMLFLVDGKPSKVNMDFQTFKDKCIKAGINIKEVCKRFSDYGYINKQSLIKFSDQGQKIALNTLKIGYYRWIELQKYYGYTNHIILSVTPKGEGRIYDIEVEEFNNFICEEICVHNSASNPNLQNMITRINFEHETLLESVKYVKKLFKAPKDHFILQSDLSQAELRVIAHISDDPVMIQAYRENIDLHSITGARIKKMSLKDFMESPNYKLDRFAAKSCNFGWTFGSSIEGYIQYVKKQTGILIDSKTAQIHKDAIFKTYVQLDVWHDKFKRIFKKEGVVSTLFGRKRHLQSSKNKGDREYSSGERKAINTPVQGTAGEWTLFSIVLLWFRLPREVRMFNTVHDSTLKYVPRELLLRTMEITKETFEQLPTQEYFDFKLKVPMKVDFEVSDKSWGDCEEYKQVIN